MNKSYMKIDIVLIMIMGIVLNSLEECPSKEDLKNIWTHTIGVAKEGLDNTDKNNVKIFLYDTLWNETRALFCKTVATEVVEYANDFFSLINDKHKLDDILKFIYSFLEHFKILKKELYVKHQKELLKEIAQTLKR
ncbi:hypothetical protein PFAG_02226 [Plasmodium falciparum Santa Lucia]|uniref:Uncharacterized protein n=7 Tax=Plasmodium falciparum TaxID=5833 RepID=W7K755_PLAFO|nr:hypothetical protein PFFVO_02275 [Plasmodium falciparum Vietnam Oak-Knoll (FVO)]ETW37047.1 hypothetical protein PFTANZ_02347 [Plasmodium falciparum Tanzania (2000708)]ETW43482.1 hypothetical protein PFNF135_02395 [Plasmodium falciparum NF135/5.C10]ETW49746.1 hypothetical protein PFMALIP_02280 [Plasmodium falciparum MaliPS096_E11]EUR72734.1 hypothetical protein PFBG_02309 [Plasmodium falciparum 7G8]EUT87403.1 hypothetical protein PFAG_02226 [Plasmodium falciparum Santa Lucia]EWC88875.1 hypo